ncbi:acylneuraminate cytidylyltransferase family protein [Lysinibacillus sp. FSL M8-0134]|uniref:acylneuraminate cytidylyltransferase family protein n=1 Tax=Lysinibacillus sp. FSL M8-0134 TaxID=2921717 RepID=UPI003119B44E
MYKGKSILAIIPARKGSKGIRRKNMYDINGKPLIFYTINEAKKSIYIDDILVSTDCIDTKKYVESFSIEVPFLRASSLAQDETNIIDVILADLKKLKLNGKVYDYIIVLQPTQPLRRKFHIDDAIKLIVETNKSSLVSVSKVTEHPYFIRELNKDGSLKSIINVNSTIRRQELPNYYKVNGLIYINKIDENLNEYTSLNDNELAFITDIKYDLDIDSLEDIKKFKGLINYIGQ